MLQVGKEFDALVIDPGVEDSPFDVHDSDDTTDVLQKFIFLGGNSVNTQHDSGPSQTSYAADDRNIVEVYVSGHKCRV